jgi:hypothetical protein
MIAMKKDSNEEVQSTDVDSELEKLRSEIESMLSDSDDDDAFFSAHMFDDTFKVCFLRYGTATRAIESFREAGKFELRNGADVYEIRPPGYGVAAFLVPQGRGDICHLLYRQARLHRKSNLLGELL